MKKLFTFICCCASLFVKGQCHFGWSYDLILSFDDTCFHRLVDIDTVNYHHNIWQIGHPQKTLFDSAYSGTRAIVTDTLNPYMSSDTSAFYFKVPQTFGPAFERVSFHYKLDVDPSAQALIEVSEDHGASWINLADSMPSGITYVTPLIYDTSSWSLFFAERTYSPLYPSPAFVDTYLFRFTFIPGSSAISHDGWIIDDLTVRYWWESVPQLQNPNLITLYPNPTHGNLYTHTDKPQKNATITIYNTAGQQVYTAPAPANGHLNLQLPNGIYTLRYSDEEEYCVKQIVIQH